MLGVISDIVQYAFMQRALLGGVMIAITCSLIGTFLVLRKLSLLGDGLAHVAFGGIAIGMLFGFNPIVAALAATILGSLGIQRLVKNTKVYGDAATGIMLTLGVAIAVVIIGAVKGFSVNLFSYLFGSILALSQIDIFIILGVMVITVTFISVYYKKLVFMSFNEELARLNNIKIDTVNVIFAIIVAMTVVISIRAVGILLVSAMLIIPAVTALQIARSFKNTLVIASIFSIITVMIGIILAFTLDLPPGGMIVLTMCAGFALTLTLEKMRKNINTQSRKKNVSNS